MEQNPSAGMPITAAVADKYLKKHVEIRENLQRKFDSLKESELSPEAEKDVSIFYNADTNAFIFTRELVERFFKPVDEYGNPQVSANYLMVILGAKYEGENKGRPTIVVTGVNKDEKDNCYHALDITYAANEQPPTQDLLAFPGTNGCDPVQININVQ